MNQRHDVRLAACVATAGRGLVLGFDCFNPRNSLLKYLQRWHRSSTRSCPVRYAVMKANSKRTVPFSSKYQEAQRQEASQRQRQECGTQPEKLSADDCLIVAVGMKKIEKYSPPRHWTRKTFQSMKIVDDVCLFTFHLRKNDTKYVVSPL